MSLAQDHRLLPDELLLQILVLLDNKELRFVAHASRRLRALCVDQPEYFFPCQLNINLNEKERVYSSVVRFITLLREITAFGQSLALRVIAVFTQWPDGPGPDLTILQRWPVALEAISAAFAAEAKVVSIHFDFSLGFWTNEMMARTMAHPAPWLRRLSLIGPAVPWAPSIRLPAGIFCGTAPKLKEVSLRNVHVERNAGGVEAFRNVSIVKHTGPAMDGLLHIGETFPNAREIDLWSLSSSCIVDFMAAVVSAATSTVTQGASIGCSQALVLRVYVDQGQVILRSLGDFMKLVAPNARTVEVDMILPQLDLQLFGDFINDLATSVFKSGAILFVIIIRRHEYVEYLIEEPNMDDAPSLSVRFIRDEWFVYGYTDQPIVGIIAALKVLRPRICGVRIDYMDIEEFTPVWTSFEQLGEIEVDITSAPELLDEDAGLTAHSLDNSHQHRISEPPLQRSLFLFYCGPDLLRLPTTHAVLIANRLGLLEGGDAVVISLWNVVLDSAETADLPSTVSFES